MPKQSTKTTKKQTKTSNSSKKQSYFYEFNDEKDKRLNGLKVKFDKTIFSPKIKTLPGQTYKNKSKFIQVAVHSRDILNKKQMEGLTNLLNNQIYEKFGDKFKIEARNAVKSGAYCMEKNRYLIEQEDLNHSVKEFMVDSNENNIKEANIINDTDTFYISYYLTNQSGNAAENNKCFYNILKEYDIIDDIDEFIKENELNEEGTVSIKDIPKIEDLLKINIEVYGDMLYKRINYNEAGNPLKTPKYDKTLIMELRNGHFIKYENKPEDIPGMQREFKKHIKYNIYWEVDDYYFDGEDFYEEIDLNNSYYVSFKEIKNYVEDETKYNIDNIDYLKKCYENYMNDLEDFNNCLKEYNKKYKNYFADYYEFKGMNEYIKNYISNNDALNKIGIKYEQFERIEKNEFDWLNAASKGGVYSYLSKKTKEKKRFYSYDINSAYPACLLSNEFYIPYKRGEYIKILPKYINRKIENYINHNTKDMLQYGIYKCKITPDISNEELEIIKDKYEREFINNEDDYIISDDEIKKICKYFLFRFNEVNYYTHYDLIVAYKLGFKIELIDDKINALIYSKDKLIKSPLQFRRMLNTLYELKENKHNKIVKQMLNTIWGTLTTHKKGMENKHLYIENEEDEIVLNQDEYIENIKEYEDDKYEFSVYNYDKLTLYRYYRLKPFLTSFQRYNMFKVCEYFDFIVGSFNTDSIGLLEELTEEEFEKLNEWYKKLINCDYNDERKGIINNSSLGRFKKEF